MTITQAQAVITMAYKAGLIDSDRAQWYAGMIRRTEGYGHAWSWKRQGVMRDNLILDNTELDTAN